MLSLSPPLWSSVNIPRHWESHISNLSKISSNTSNKSSFIVKPVLNTIIHTDQKGFVAGGNISEINRMIDDIIEFVDNEDVSQYI
jgi:hypothetical protein